MIKRFLAVVILLLSLATVVQRAESESTTTIKVVGNSYENVYIGVSPDLSEEGCEEMLTQLEATLAESSQLLFEMSGSRVNFGSQIYLVLPPDFDCGEFNATKVAMPGWDYDFAPIKLGPTHSLFGNTIWTQQSGQCGSPGDFIYMTPASLGENATQTHTVRQFVGEWAKFRWGVMEEVGHIGDSIYPPTYSINSDNEYIPTACTDVPLLVSNNTHCSDHETCVLDIDQDLNTAPTSSILSLPELPNVVSLCTDATHDTSAPTKQNLLCKQRSAEGIFYLHSDHSISPGSTVPTLKITTLIQAPVVASVIIAVETTTGSLDGLSYQKQYLLDGICQAVMALMQDGIYFNIVHFDETAYNLMEMNILGPERTSDICIMLENVFDSSRLIKDRSIVNAISKSSEMLPPDSSIILICDGTTDPSEDLNDAVSASLTNRVFPIVYPKLPGVDVNEEWFNQLAESTGTYVAQFIETPTDQENNILPIARHDMATVFMTRMNLIQRDVTYIDDEKECTTGSTNEKFCTETLSISDYDATSYMIAVYSTAIVDAYLGDISPKCQEIDHSTSFPSSATFNCEGLSSRDDISVTAYTVTEGERVFIVLMSVYQAEAVSNSTYMSLRSSTSLSKLAFRDNSAPIIYGEVFHEGRPVFGALITVFVDINNVEQQVTIQLKDSGSGADVTGNDGVYSGYLVGLPMSNASSGPIDVMLKSSCSSAEDRPLYVLPKISTLEDFSTECCGSMITLPSNIEQVNNFNVDITINARVTEPQSNNLPPARITDLKVELGAKITNFIFTAPGSELDGGGKVSRYEIISNKLSSGETRTQSISSGIESAGDLQVIDLRSENLDCDVLISYSVVATDDDGLSGEESNVVTKMITCDLITQPLTAGGITAIVLGVVFLVIIIFMITYLCCNWSDRRDMKMYKLFKCKCKCCKKDKNKTSQMRKISYSSEKVEVKKDLYSKTNLEKKHADQKQKSSPNIPTIGRTNEGFFNENLDEVSLSHASSVKAQSNINNSDPDNNYKYGMHYDLAQSTLQPTLPINNVGIPVKDDYSNPLGGLNPQQSGPFFSPPSETYASSHSDYQFSDYIPNSYGSNTSESRLNTAV